MRTQQAHRLDRARGLRALASVALAALLVLPGAASAQGGGGASGVDGGPSSELLLGGAGLLLLAAVLLGYGVPALRRRRAPRADARVGGTRFASSLVLAHHSASRASQPPARAPRSAAAEPLAWTPGFTQTGRPSPESGNAASHWPPTGPGEPAAPYASPAQAAGEPSRFGRRGAGPGLVPGRVPHPGRQLALGYTTFPERKRAVSPESRYQARRIRAACEARGMLLHKLVGDVQSYAGPDLERPGLNHALELLSAGEISCLVVAGLDRLSRSAANLGTVIEWLEQLDARLVVLDIDLDTHTEEGRVAARALARVGALERQSGAEAARRPRREREERPSSGRLAAVSDRPLLQRRIATMRASGMTLQAIADTLNREGVPTLRGGEKWRPSSVQAATGYKRPGRDARERAPAEHEDER
jgi:DNA invertase Pin-like site-specific DNA recombinase